MPSIVWKSSIINLEACYKFCPSADDRQFHAILHKNNTKLHRFLKKDWHISQNAPLVLEQPSSHKLNDLSFYHLSSGSDSEWNLQWNGVSGKVTDTDGQNLSLQPHERL